MCRQTGSASAGRTNCAWTSPLRWRAPAWLRRSFADRNPAKARGAKVEFAERIAAAIERRFIVTWLGSYDASENARPIEDGGPLFGGPDSEVR